MKYAVITCSFDPVTEEELSFAKDLRRSGKADEIWLQPESEGILPQEERLALLQKAVKPYRHLHAGKAPDSAVSFACEECRGKEKTVREGHFRYAAHGIQQMLLENGCYMEEIVTAQCKPHRAEHSRGVAQTARTLAGVHHLDEKKAYIMGMLHDITKKLPDEEGGKIIARWKPEWQTISPKVWHSYTAVVFLKQEMNCRDSRILHAIEHHTIGDGHSAYDHILYIADKIEPGRGYDASAEMAASCRNLAGGAAMIREESRKYIYEKEGVHV